MLGLPIASGVYLVSDDVIRLVYGGGRYAEAGAVLRVLAVQVPFTLAQQVGTLPMLASKREHALAKLLFGALVANVALAALLVPKYGARGAAIGTLIAGVGSVLGTAVLAAKWVRLVSAARVLRIVASTAAMVAVAWAARRALGFWGAVLVGPPVYIVALLGLGAITWAELRALAKRRDAAIAAGE
jgi:O-antigen/teichoic acid export membrane protein